MRLYHYTCDDRVEAIKRQRWLRGTVHPYFADLGAIVWLTDLDTPDRDALGLSQTYIACDRTRHRVTVVTDKAEHWPVLARRIPRQARESLELAPGALPMHWYVAVDELIPVLAVEAVAHA